MCLLVQLHYYLNNSITFCIEVFRCSRRLIFFLWTWFVVFIQPPSTACAKRVLSLSCPLASEVVSLHVFQYGLPLFRVSSIGRVGEYQEISVDCLIYVVLRYRKILVVLWILYTYCLKEHFDR